ncbi:MAG: hypothetical protein LBT57_03120 [Puniceicoccales bacterium]|jgi:hypothetical protein|nr:hypothetical protein [Puniceicoccales bacterium]
MGRDPLSPKDLTHLLNRYRGSLQRRSSRILASSCRRAEQRGGSQSLCDRLALYLLLGTALLQGFAMLIFDIF